MTAPRQSPPVQVQGDGGLGWRMLSIGLPTLAVGSLGAWGLQWAELGGVWVLVGASKLMALTAAGLSLRPARMQRLAWDGQHWRVDGHHTRVQLMLDLGPWMLLRLRPEASSGSRWLPLAASEAGTAWGALRAALYVRSPGDQAAAGHDRPQPEHQTR